MPALLGQLAVWWLVIQALGLAGLPMTRFLLRSLPDRGYAFAKPLGLLFTGYLAWLTAMLGLASFGAPLLVVAALALALLGWRLGARNHPSGPRLDLRGRMALVPWRAILGYEALFLAALVFVALLRAHATPGPTPWGTERPMDFALFNAIRNSPNFPPHDPWLAGFSINYYYLGYLLMAAMAALSGLEPAVAYNLSLALIFALTALGVAGIVVNLIGLSGRRVSALGRALAAIGAVALVLFAGNQGGALQVISGTPMITALDGPDMARALANGLGPRRPLDLTPPFKGWDFDGTSVITPTNTFQDFNWWNPSRALWDSYLDPADPSGQPARRYTITEFPFFSFWLGDMHPHVMALPFGLLAAALALHLLARPAAPPFLMGWRGWLELAASGVILGSLYAINSWDFPTYLLLYLGALLLLHRRLAAVPRPLEGDAPLSGVQWRIVASQAMMVVIASLLMFAPFYLTFRSLVGGREPLVNLPILATITRTLGFVTWGHTALHTFLIIFGLFFVPLAAFVAAQRRAGPPRWLAWAVPAVLLAGLLVGFPLLALLPLGAYAALLALARPERPAEAFALWAFALGCLICFGTEIVYIRDTFEGGSSRMNTIFKFYYQVWLLWGTLAAYALWWLLARPGEAAGRRVRWLGAGAAAVVVVLLAGGLLYPWLTAGRAFRDTPLVGLAGKTPRQNTPGGAAAIDWLRANARSGDVVLEATGESDADAYDGKGLGIGGVSASTGLATVLGWPGHEQQWRAGDPPAREQIGPRRQDVIAIYSGTLSLEQTRALLDRYNVRYIYVGQAERQLYPQAGLERLAQLGKPVFQQGDVVIYEVGR